MLIYVTPIENTDVGFLRSKYVEVEQDVPEGAKHLRTKLKGHPKPRAVKVEATNTLKVVRVVNDSDHIAQLRVNTVFAVFEVDDDLLDYAGESHGGPDELTATFHASEVTLDDHITTLNLTPAVAETLVEAGIQFISDLRAASNEDLLAIEGIGPVTLDKIVEALVEYDST
jgi:hypothetical protein